MSDTTIYLYLIAMIVATYLIRVLPLTLIRKEIKNKYIKTFLYYVPYVTLSVMTFPAMIYATHSIWSGIAAFVVAIGLALKGFNMFQIAVISCVVVLVSEFIV